MADEAARRSWSLPTATALVCIAGAVLLTRGLGAAATPAGPTAAPTAVARGTVLSARASGPLRDLVPSPEQWGYGWVADQAAASQQITDGPGLLHPCGVTYPSDAVRVEVSRHNVLQNDRDVPAGMAMTVELARYDGGGAVRALQERVAALQACSSYRTTFAGYADTPVDVALLAPPPGGSSTAAHVAVTPATRVGPQVVEYTFLVAQQGDVLLSAVVGNGNGSGNDLDTFAAGYFHQARLKLAGLPHPSPEQALAGPAG